MDILEFNINYQLILSVIGTILAVLLVFLILQFFWLRAKVNRLYRKYKYFMMGEDGGSIEMKLSTEVRELRDMVESSQGMLHQQELLATMQLKSFQKIGLVRYDAFDETGDKLSFSLTLLDGKNNGVVLSSLAGHRLPGAGQGESRYLSYDRYHAVKQPSHHYGIIYGQQVPE